jgi:hypothetical protein
MFPKSPRKVSGNIFDTIQVISFRAYFSFSYSAFVYFVSPFFLSIPHYLNVNTETDIEKNEKNRRKGNVLKE